MLYRTVLAVALAVAFAGDSLAQTSMSRGSRGDSGSYLGSGNVLGEARPTQRDVVVMTNGDRLIGVVQNERFRIRTPYTSVTIEGRLVAGLSLNIEPNGRAAIISVNGDRFTGYVDEGDILFKTTGGTEMRLGRQFVTKVIFAKRPDELTNVGTNDLFVVGNSDSFTGRFVDPSFTVSTPYTTHSVPGDDVASIVISGLYGGRTNVRLLDGGLLSGHLTPEKFDVALDIGGQITIDTRAVGLTKFQRKSTP